MLVVFLRTSKVLFRTEEPMKETPFCQILVFRKGQIKLLKLFEPANSKISFR